MTITMIFKIIIMIIMIIITIKIKIIIILNFIFWIRDIIIISNSFLKFFINIYKIIMDL